MEGRDLFRDAVDVDATARELLADRAAPERVRAAAEARRVDEALWSELCELGWPGIAIGERWGGQGLGCGRGSPCCSRNIRSSVRTSR